MTIRYTLILAFSLFIFQSSSNAQVVINEFSAANFNDHQDNFGDYEDWIELYNTGASSVDLGGYYLSDKDDNLTKWEIPAGTTIGAGDFLIFYCSSRDNNNHTNFKITQTRNSENVIFSDPSGVIIDQNPIDKPNQKNHSWGRATDGAADWRVFTDPSPNNSNNNNASGGDYAPKPDIDLEAGAYPGPITITVSEDNPNLTFYYTTDGSTPSSSSTMVTGPIDIDNTVVFKTIAYHNDADTLKSFVKTSTYFINENHVIPIISISGDELMDLLFGGWGDDPEGFFEFFNASGEFEDESYGDFNKHGNDSWAYDQRGVDYIVRDQFGYDYAIKEQLYPRYSDRDRFQRIMLKAAANDNYSFEWGGAHIRDAYLHNISQRSGMELDERSTNNCVVYANGEYWGVYEYREKVDDHDYTEFYYDQSRDDIDFIKTWGGTWEEYGSRDDWDDLIDYITNNDMSIDANYQYVTEQLEVISLIDYIILNVQAVCKDWLNWNTAWWRGRNPDGGAQKWRYALWDLDASFGHYINFTGIDDESPQADPCAISTDLPADFEGHTHILTELFENEDFHNLYVNRYADFNNSIFSCDSMFAVLDEMIGFIEPEMQRQIDRWGGSYTGWQNNVAALEDFINQRCAAIDGGIEDCYDVEGPFEVVVIVEPVGSPNAVRVNTIYPNAFPWTGDYFTGVDLDFEALSADGWQFVEYEILNNTAFPSLTDSLISVEFNNGPDTIIAHFEETVQIADTRLTVVVEPEGAGTVSLNGVDLSALPHLEYFFDGSPIELSVEPSAPNYTFLNWQSNEHSLSPNDQSQDVSFVLTISDVVVAFFEDENAPEPVGIEEEIFSGIQFYPNPVQDYLMINDRDRIIEGIQIFNLQGQEVFSIWNDIPQSISFNQLGVKAGMYLMTVHSQGEIATKQIVYTP